LRGAVYAYRPVLEVTCIRELTEAVAGLLQWKPVFNSKSLPVGFMMGKVELVIYFSQGPLFFIVSMITPVQHIRSSVLGSAYLQITLLLNLKGNNEVRYVSDMSVISRVKVQIRTSP
jgi:hypothetical protein